MGRRGDLFFRRLHLLRGSPEERRYRRERVRLVIKTVVAAVIAWLAAMHLPGAANPYFAPLGAVMSIYPTAARSVNEAALYVGGFLVGAAIAIPVGMLVGANTLGIAVTLLLALAVSSWRRLGDQSAQVSFTALFVLLFGGDQAWQYTVPRLADLGVGIAVGLIVNVAVYPPLYLRSADRVLAALGVDTAAALTELAQVVSDPERGWTTWSHRDDQMTRSARGARSAFDQAYESLHWNSRALLARRRTPLPYSSDIAVIEQVVALTRGIGQTLREALYNEEGSTSSVNREFRGLYAGVLRRIAPLLPELAADAPHGRGPDTGAAWDAQHEMEAGVARRREASDVADTEHRLAWLTRRILRELDHQRQEYESGEKSRRRR
ncbi:putative membrane protein YccC [Spinactinospora alkalitolerans]|uniref:Putative membrane protein YccC n=1 Tax=Spinactinospora alkalitolerans TaxID=687207 RepID=A0A852TZN7_9ACTN|nr:aromatic acid exporter family protein [Spinactinospora alkalitolerans]NYE48233.1 putative membrane protein YccC [Spinactinospora alkalitolerans]